MEFSFEKREQARQPGDRPFVQPSSAATPGQKIRKQGNVNVSEDLGISLRHSTVPFSYISATLPSSILHCLRSQMLITQEKSGFRIWYEEKFKSAGHRKTDHHIPLSMPWRVCISFKKPPPMSSEPITRWSGGSNGSERLVAWCAVKMSSTHRP